MHLSEDTSVAKMRRGCMWTGELAWKADLGRACDFGRARRWRSLRWLLRL